MVSEQAGWWVGRQAGRQADRQRVLKFLKFSAYLSYLDFHFFIKGTVAIITINGTNAL